MYCKCFGTIVFVMFILVVILNQHTRSKQQHFSNLVHNGCNADWSFKFLVEILTQVPKIYPDLRRKAKLILPQSRLDKICQSLQSHQGAGLQYLTFLNAFSLGGNIFNCKINYWRGGCFDYRYDIENYFHYNTHRKLVKTMDNAVSIAFSLRNGINYGHWLLDSITLIASVYDKIIKNRNLKVLVNPLWSKYSTSKNFAYLTIFELLNISQSQIVLAEPGRIYFVSTLIVPYPAPHCGCVECSSYKKMSLIFQNQLLKKYTFLRTNKIQIVIQKRVVSRALKNYYAMVTNIRKTFQNANIVESFETDSLISAAQKHYVADVVIGVQGSGLSNVIFCRQNVAVIEIHPANGIHYQHHIMCHKMHPHIRIISSTGHVNQNITFLVNINKIIEAVNVSMKLQPH